MDNNKTLLIGLIAIVVIILAGIFVYSQGMHADDNAADTDIQLKTQDFKAFEIDTPVGSNFILKNNQTEVGKGMLYYKNVGNYTDEIEGIIINKNLTDSLISENMGAVSSNSSDVKIYSSLSRNGTFYEIIKTVNDTDIILAGHNLDLMEKMANTSNVKDTSGLTLKETKTIENATQAANDTVNKTQNTTKPVNKTVNKTQNTTKPANKTVNKQENAKQETKTPVEKVVEKTRDEQKAKAPKVQTTISQNNPNPVSEISDNPRETTYPLYIGGGSFTTGSELEDKTYADIYLGVEHAGEEIGIKIFYYRDGNSLNQGNYVTTTVESTGYVNIASADSYSLYPDYAIVKVFDCNGNLQDTQEITLEPTSGTQYF